jgi:hypothetical protein
MKYNFFFLIMSRYHMFTHQKRPPFCSTMMGLPVHLPILLNFWRQCFSSCHDPAQFVLGLRTGRLPSNKGRLRVYRKRIVYPFLSSRDNIEIIRAGGRRHLSLKLKTNQMPCVTAIYTSNTSVYTNAGVRSSRSRADVISILIILCFASTEATAYLA